MKSLLSWSLKKSMLLAGVAATLLPLVAVAKEAPKVTIVLKGRHGHGTPHRSGCAHTGGGNTIVEQPKDDTVIITQTGVAVAGPHPHGSCAGFDLDTEQCFEIVFADEKLKKAKLTLDAIVVGLLRCDKHGGCASFDLGQACVSAAGNSVVQVSM